MKNTLHDIKLKIEQSEKRIIQEQITIAQLKQEVQKIINPKTPQKNE